MKETLQFLKDCGTFYLATIDGDQPRVRPFGAVCEFEGKLYIVTHNQKNVYQQMMANPKVEISGMRGSEWIRLEGEVVLDTNREARVKMLEDNDKTLKNLYSADDGVMAVLYITNATATISSFTAEPVVYTF